MDKAVYSAFADPRLAPALRRKGIGTLIVTGGETDVCVLATVMAAVDLGFRVVLPVDALCSARDNTHDDMVSSIRHMFPASRKLSWTRGPQARLIIESLGQHQLCDASETSRAYPR